MGMGIKLSLINNVFKKALSREFLLVELSTILKWAARLLDQKCLYIYIPLKGLSCRDNFLATAGYFKLQHYDEDILPYPNSPVI